MTVSQVDWLAPPGTDRETAEFWLEDGVTRRYVVYAKDGDTTHPYRIACTVDTSDGNTRPIQAVRVLAAGDKYTLGTGAPDFDEMEADGVGVDPDDDGEGGVDGYLEMQI